jgi:peptide/nickel transport system substrate-binding protein
MLRISILIFQGEKMKKAHFPILTVCINLFLLSTLLLGCTPAATETAESQPAETSPAQTEAIPAENAASPAQSEATGPQPGGKLVFTGYSEPETLDPALTSSIALAENLGASLVTIDPEGEIAPYLAESWSVSDDQLTWTFNLRHDIKFSDGTPLTAQDYAWTFTRGLDPDTASPIMGFLLGDVASVEASDDYTLVMKYNTPYANLLFNLTASGYTQPISQAAFERLGGDFGRNPVGVGPFVLEEWVTGDHITLARNPIYNWAPAFAHQGPAYLDEIEFDFITEYATILASLEAGDILATDKVQPQDVQRLKDLGEFDVFETTHFGMWPAIFINSSLAPFDDVKVRQALSYSIDRTSIQDIVYFGLGQVISGPLNAGTFGYSAALEESGYTLDLEKAAQLMTEAGYTLNADNVWEKDGQPLQVTLKISTLDETWRKMGELIQSQWKEFGIDCQLELLENAVVESDFMGGETPLAMMAMDWADGGTLLGLVFNSQSMNLSFSGDAELDNALNAIASTTDPAAQQLATDAAVEYIMQNAYVITTVAKPEFVVVSNQLGGVVMNPVWHDLYMSEIYFK